MLVKRGPFTVIATCFSWDYLHTMNEDYHYIIPSSLYTGTGNLRNKFILLSGKKMHTA